VLFNAKDMQGVGQEITPVQKYGSRRILAEFSEKNKKNE